MFDLTNGWVVGGWVLGVVLLFGVGTLLFLAGCALADVNGPSFLKAILIYGAAVVVCAPLAGLLLYLAGKYESDPNALLGPIRGAALGVWLLAAWVLSALLYALLLAVSYRKGLLIAGTELLLSGLVAALVSAIVLVVLAVVQIARNPSPRTTAAPVSATVSLSAPERP
jgi:surface polysaccharide O-acyltransferase-like enzyme